MAGVIFWDVDTQYDFMRADGKLYVPGAEDIVPRLEALRAPGDTELSDDPDFSSTFPPHCLRGTTGQERIPETRLDDPLVITPVSRTAQEVRREVREHGGDVLVLKHEFDVFTNPNVDAALVEIDPDVIVLFGVALDVCDRFAVEGLLQRRPRTRIRVVTDAVRAIDASAGDRLLADWRDRGVELVKTAQVLADHSLRAAGLETM